jgi:hypothetical protein
MHDRRQAKFTGPWMDWAKLVGQIAHSCRKCARRSRTYLFLMPSHSLLPVRCSLPILADLPITETIDEVIVYHSNRLHVRIHDRRANETESPALKVLAERIGFDRSCGNLSHELSPVKLWLSVNEAPTIGIEASIHFLDFEKRACVAYGGLDLHAIANDLRI